MDKLTRWRGKSAAARPLLCYYTGRLNPPTISSRFAGLEIQIRDNFFASTCCNAREALSSNGISLACSLAFRFLMSWLPSILS